MTSRWIIAVRAGRRSAAALAGALLASLAPLACGDPEIELPRPLAEGSSIRYPLELWNEGVEGEARLRVRVDAEGRVDSVAVLESSGRAGLDSAAVAGARDLRFEPARGDGGPLTVWAVLPVRFTTSPGGAP